MADTRVQIDVEKWMVKNYLHQLYNLKFTKKELTLCWGGKFEFDAVSEDSKMAGCISTGKAKTASGKLASGKYQKILSDALYLTAAVGVAAKFLLFTDPKMKSHFEKERDNGRFPPDIELLYAPPPAHLRTKLKQSAAAASREVTNPK